MEISVKSKYQKIARFLLNNISWVVLIILIIAFSFTIRGFLTFENFRNIIYHSVFIGILAIAQTYVVISGNLDLSVESTAAASAIIGAWLTASSATASGLRMNTLLAFIIVIAIGAFIGAFNALFVIKLKINSFLVTLGTYIIIRGLAVFVTKGIGMNELPFAFRFLAKIKWLEFPLMVYLMFIMFIFFEYILKSTRFGRHIFVIGGNINAGINFGINVNDILLKVFLLSGVISALTGWLMAARINGANASIGSGYLFEVLAAVVIGGVSLGGGSGSLIGVFAGVLILSSISNALNITAVSPYLTAVIRGSLIIAAISLDSLKRAFKRS